MNTPSKSGFRLRRLLQFRLRTLLALLLLASFAMAAWHRYLESYREQQQATDAVSRYARHIVFQPGRPAWMRHFSTEQVFKDIVHLSFQSNRKFGDQEIVHLAKMPRLARLSLQHTSVTDDGLRHLSKLMELNTLSLESTRITDEGLRHLSGLSKLRMLQLNMTKVTGDGLRHLRELEELERLEIVGVALNDRHLDSLLRLSNLKELQVNGSLLSEDGYARLSALQKLERLDLRGSRIAELRLQGLPKLKTLIVRGSIRGLRLHDLPQLSELHSTIPGDTSLRNLPSLKSLELKGWQMRDGALESLGNLSALQTLDLTQAKVVAHPRARQNTWRHLASLSAIRDLRLGFTGITGPDLQYLSGLQTLRVVTLAGNPIRGEDLAHLRNLRDLKALDLSDTHCFETGLGQHTAHGNLRRSPLFRPALIPHVGFEHLLRLPRLETLSLSGTGVVLEELLMLRELPRVSTLVLTADLSEAEFETLQSQLPTTSIAWAQPPRRWMGFPRITGLDQVFNTQNVPTAKQFLLLQQMTHLAAPGFRQYLTPSPAPIKVIPQLEPSN